MDRDIRTFFLFIGFPAVLITAAGLAALVFGVSGIANEIKVLDVEKQFERYEHRIKSRMSFRLKTYLKNGVADHVWKIDALPDGMAVSTRAKYGVHFATNGATIGWARIDNDTVLGCNMPPFKPEDRTTLYLIVVGATIVALLFFILFMGGVLLARAAKRAREDLEVKNTFLDVISHELNTPLGSIVPLSSALSSGMIKNPSRQAEAIATISRESERMARMVSELLTVVRLKNKKLKFSREKVSIPEVVDNAASLVRLRYPDCTIMIAGGECVSVLADNDKTQQVLVNLLENACRYAGESDIQVSWCCNADGFVRVQVSDRGPGIPEEERKHLFRRFYQVSACEGISEGLGLGLNIVFEFAKGMGGNTEVCSREGGGSVFVVSLPLFLQKMEGDSQNG